MADVNTGISAYISGEGAVFAEKTDFLVAQGQTFREEGASPLRANLEI